MTRYVAALGFEDVESVECFSQRYFTNMAHEDLIIALLCDDNSSWTIVKPWVCWLPSQWGFVGVS